jgi:hypothetical protein
LTTRIFMMDHQNLNHYFLSSIMVAVSQNTRVRRQDIIHNGTQDTGLTLLCY